MPGKIPQDMIQHLPHFSTRDIGVDVLRTDRIHPVISGNKWFKLKYYIREAKETGKNRLATFGGAFSNHIVATAYAGNMNGLQTTGFIRGEELAHIRHRSPTLQQAAVYGMELVFINRTQYRDKNALITGRHYPDCMWIPEGGYGPTGAKGAAEILDPTVAGSYTHILCAAGTGTMMAGLIRAAAHTQEVIGISVLKGHKALPDEVRSLLNEHDKQKTYSIRHDYHFGGYARHPAALLGFMREIWHLEQLPTDIVYTSKLFFAVKDMIIQKQFPLNSKLLVVHSGGLQGNASLPSGTLPF